MIDVSVYACTSGQGSRLRASVGASFTHAISDLYVSCVRWSAVQSKACHLPELPNQISSHICTHLGRLMRAPLLIPVLVIYQQSIASVSFWSAVGGQTMEEFVIERRVQLVIVDSIAVFARAEFGQHQTAERQQHLGMPPPFHVSS